MEVKQQKMGYKAHNKPKARFTDALEPWRHVSMLHGKQIKGMAGIGCIVFAATSIHFYVAVEP